MEKSQIIDGSKIANGDTIYAPSVHYSNGYSLVRKICTPDAMRMRGFNADLATPTKIYVSDVWPLVNQLNINGIAHITGGGLIENIERILPWGWFGCRL